MPTMAVPPFRRVRLPDGSGRIAWVDANGNFIRLDTADPGLSAKRENDIMSRLPDAEMAGFDGPGIVPIGTSQGRGLKAEEPTLLAPARPTHRPLGGAQPNNRGATVKLSPSAFGSVLGNPTAVGRLDSVVETPRDAGDDAEVITVALGVEWEGLANGDNPDGGLIMLKAIVNWGIGGSSFTATLDWINGLVFSVPASFLRVGASYEALSLGGGTRPDAFLSAALAYGDHAKASETRITGIFAEILVGASLLLEVPRFATSFSISPLTTAPSVLIEQLTNRAAGAPLALAQHVYGQASNTASQRADTFPLVNGARALRLTNQGANPIGNGVFGGTIIWNLSI